MCNRYFSQARFLKKSSKPFSIMQHKIVQVNLSNLPNHDNHVGAIYSLLYACLNVVELAYLNLTAGGHITRGETAESRRENVYSTAPRICSNLMATEEYYLCNVIICDILSKVIMLGVIPPRRPSQDSLQVTAKRRKCFFALV